MNKKIREIVDACKEDCAAGRDQKKSTIVELLEVDPASDDALYIRAAADELTRAATGCRGWVSFSIGLDYVPCKGNCRFCCFGAEWGIVNGDNANVLTHDQIIATAKSHLEQGATSVTLRTTEFYPHDDLVELTRRMRAEVPGNYRLGINTGELSLQDCIDFYEAGANSAAHMLRLREGVDTGIDPEIRLRTIENIKASPLRWGCCIDPVGPEHTPEEIADLFLKYHELGSNTCNIMKRSNVAGTPLGDADYGELTEEQCLLYAGALRICSGVSRVGGCHPATEATLHSGGCNMGIETGAVPRTEKFVEGEWPPRQVADAIAAIERAGLRKAGADELDPRQMDAPQANAGCSCCG